ncbi:MAG TPA: hypothetical protein VGR22_03555 [Thermomicrobiales bacterium]|nr:hypothetical protein [Thermomicrobiales bacterium]
MSKYLRSVPIRALMIGIAAGMRSQIPGAVLAWRQDDAPFYASWRRWPVLRSVWGRRVLMLSAAGEVIADKTSAVPPRTKPGPLFGRMLFGGIAGAAIGSERRGKGPLVRGALLGVLGGLIGSYGGMRARASVAQITGLPDQVVAVFEDVAAVSIANRAITKR